MDTEITEKDIKSRIAWFKNWDADIAGIETKVMLELCELALIGVVHKARMEKIRQQLNENEKFTLTIQQSIDKLNEVTRREGVPWKLLSGAIGLNPEVHVGWNSIIVFREESEALVLQLAARSLEEKLMRKISDEVQEKLEKEQLITTK